MSLVKAKARIGQSHSPKLTRDTSLSSSLREGQGGARGQKNKVTFPAVDTSSWKHEDRGLGFSLTCFPPQGPHTCCSHSLQCASALTLYLPNPPHPECPAQASLAQRSLPCFLVRCSHGSLFFRLLITIPVRHITEKLLLMSGSPLQGKCPEGKVLIWLLLHGIPRLLAVGSTHSILLNDGE